jgi:hypothetical protein
MNVFPREVDAFSQPLMNLWVNQILAMFKKQALHVRTTPFLLFAALLGSVIGAGLSIAIFGSFQTLYLDTDSPIQISSALFYYYPSDPTHDAVMNQLPPYITRRGFTSRIACINYTLENYEDEIRTQPNFAHIALETVGNTTSYTIASNPDGLRASTKSAYQLLLENAILNAKLNRKTTMSASWKFFQGAADPSESYYGPSHSVYTYFIPALMAFGSIPLLVLFLNAVAVEKQQKTLGLLRRLGLRESALWASLFLLSILVCFFSSLFGSLTIKYGSPSTMEAIHNAELGPLWVIHFFFHICMVGYALVWSSVISRPLFVNLFTALMVFSVFPINVYFMFPSTFA